MKLGRSKAGHDKDVVYVILKEDADYYYLVNGINRTVANPKKKNKTHIQPIIHLAEDLQSLMPEEEKADDLLIKRILKLYQEEERCRKQM